MKTTKGIIKLTVFVFCMFMVIQSCKHEPIIAPDPGGNHIIIDTVILTSGGYTPIVGSSGDTTKDSVCFNEDILPLILSNCAKSGCHDAVSHNYGGTFTTYSEVLRIVKAGNPSQSELYTVITSSGGGNLMPPYPNSPLTQAQIDVVKKWIAEGAKNNIDCGMSCDTAIYTYAGAVDKTIQSYCVGCHNGSLSAGGINLIGYSNVLTQVNNGKLWGDINHFQGFNAMPTNGTMIEDCRITTIKKWIAAGAPNN